MSTRWSMRHSSSRPSARVTFDRSTPSLSAIFLCAAFSHPSRCRPMHHSSTADWIGDPSQARSVPVEQQDQARQAHQDKVAALADLGLRVLDRERVVKHIAKKGWALVDVFAGEGYSGSLDHTQRPDLGELMKRARQTLRPLDLVTVYEERAIGRADRAFWPWVWELQDLGVFVAVTKGDYDNTSDEGRSRMRKAADRAEDERITIRDRTQGGIQEKAEDGGHFGGRPPFGWRIVNKGVKGESHLALDTDGDVDGEKLSCAALRMGWRFIVKEHNSLNKAASRLDALGYHSPTGGGWCGETLYRILTSPSVQRGVRIFRNPATAGRERGTKLDADGTPLYGSTVEVKARRVFTEEEVRLLNAALKRQARGPRAEDATSASAPSNCLAKSRLGSGRARDRRSAPGIFRRSPRSSGSGCTT
ncbi:recombinase family protein [Streptomyces sp. NPDC126933]|uniref:recombinase family protein n=1 Tax=unclassified Streptomyces TaxID=2593676 RepID=UPI00365CDBED